MISKPDRIQQIDGLFPFLRRDDPQFRQRFLRSASLTRLGKGVTVCREGMQCGSLALLLSGSTRVFKLGESGREITLYRIGPGGSCILTASCIVNEQPFPALAVTETEVEALTVPTAEVRRWLDLSPAWRGYLFSLISERLGDVISIVEEVAFKRVDRRICSYLLEHAVPGEESPGVLSTTHQKIASDLGTSREVVSRILKDLEGRHAIAVSRGSIRLLDPRALRSKAQDN